MVSLYYMRNRWYDPELGRFVSEDPIGHEGGINLYAFAGNDPANGSDLSGSDPDCRDFQINPCKPGPIVVTATPVFIPGPGCEFGLETSVLWCDQKKVIFEQMASPSNSCSDQFIHCTFRQTTGILACTAGDDSWSFHGYSGKGLGKNSSAMESRHNLGPIPRGTYMIGAAYPGHYKDKGPVVIPLRPAATNNMYGRAGFLIHGDNSINTASEGCIIASRAMRDKLSTGGGVLTVTR